MIEQIAALFDGAAAGADGLERMGAEEPVDGVEVMYVGFDDDFAEGGAPEFPLLQLFLLVARDGEGGFVAFQSELQELAVDFADLADGARLQELLCFDVYATIALLEAEGDVLLAAGAIGRAHDAFAAGNVDAGGLFHVDVFAGLDRRFKVLRVEVDGGGDHDGVDIAGEDFAEVLVLFGFGVADALFGGSEGLRHDIADGGDFDAWILGDERTGEGAAVAGADDADLDGAVLGAGIDGLEGDEGGGLDDVATGEIGHG